MNKFWQKQWMILFIIVSSIILLLLIGRSDNIAVFQRFLADQAEETAIDCGVTLMNDAPEPRYACAFAAQQMGKGFFLQISLRDMFQ
jgi:hypothetical protein